MKKHDPKEIKKAAELTDEETEGVTGGSAGSFADTDKETPFSVNGSGEQYEPHFYKDETKNPPWEKGSGVSGINK